MQEQGLNEIWQVDVTGTIYEAPFCELGEWIGGGSLLPQDKVRKGNLRWIEARRVPSLVPFFNAKEQGLPAPVVITTTENPAPEEEIQSVVAENLSIEVAAPAILSAASAAIDPNECVVHRGEPSAYLCDGCCNGFCKACPNSYGGSVKICPMCGAMCRSVGEVKAENQRATARTHAITEGFGSSDFFNALAHPFRFKPSLFLGAIMFAFFTLGQSAAAIGGMFMMVSALFCVMLSNMLTFGVLSNTVDHFIQGNLEENFMPGFDDFSLWDDIVHPFFLSVAAYLSSFGPFFVTLAIGFYLVTSAVNTQIESYKSDLERIPGTNVYNGRELVDQTGDVKEVLSGVDQKQRERMGALTDDAEAVYDENTATTTAPVVDEESRAQEELWAAATESRKKSLESAIGKSTGTDALEEREMIQAFLGLAAPLVVIGFITFVWGLIFFPASCAVAGYSRSFVATINPLVGLDTMKRLGVNYIKILAMGFCLLIASVLVNAIFSVVLSPLDMPRMGNLAAVALSSLFTFYLSVVFSCLLGYALFKNSEKLGIRS